MADIERGFHVLKSEIEIAPVFQRSPERIRAHASICFTALVLHRVMRQRLRLAGSNLSPEAALQQLRRVQRHPLRIDGADPLAGISTIHQDQADPLNALNIKKSSPDSALEVPTCGCSTRPAWSPVTWVARSGVRCSTLVGARLSSVARKLVQQLQVAW